MLQPVNNMSLIIKRAHLIDIQLSIIQMTLTISLQSYEYHLPIYDTYPQA